MRARPSIRFLRLLLVIVIALAQSASALAGPLTSSQPSPPRQQIDNLGTNNTFGSALNIAATGSVQETIAPLGDVDWYRFAVDSQGELQIAITNVAPDLALGVRVWTADYGDLSGWIVPLAAGSDTLAVVDLPAAGRYWLEVRDGGDDMESTQLYALQTIFTPAPAAGERNNSFGTAFPLPFDSPLQATLLPRGDADWYRVTVDGHGELTVAITGVPENLEISVRVWTADYTDLSGWFRPEAAGGDTTAVVDLPAPGHYRIEVRDNGDDARSIDPYTITASFVTPADPFEPNNSFGSSTTLTFGSTVQANILPRGDVDWYRVRVDHHGELQVSITDSAPNLDLSLRVWNADFGDMTGWLRPLAAGGDNLSIVDLPAPGEYRIEVRDGGDDGRSTQAYSLRTLFTPAADPFESNNSFGSAAFLGVNRQTQANILPRGDSDWYSFSAGTQGRLDIAITSIPPNLDLMFRLWNSNYSDMTGWITPIAEGGDTIHSLEIDAPGEYTIEVRDGSDDGRSIDPYDLSISFTAATAIPDPVVPEDAAPGLTEPGSAGPGDDGPGDNGPEAEPNTGVAAPAGPDVPPSGVMPDPNLKIRVSGQVGPQGAELFVREPDDLEVNGARLNVPTGAVDDYVTIHMGTTDQPPPDAPYGMFPAGKYWVLDPDGIQFNAPVSLTLPVPAGSASAEVFIGHWDGTEWRDLGGTVENGQITAQTDGFSTFGVFCGLFASYQNVTLLNESSTGHLTLTYLSGPQPDPEMPELAPEGCPAPYGEPRRWELTGGESAHLLLRPGLYQVEVAYPTPQPGVANPLLFRVPSGGGSQTITIGDDGATSDHPDAKIVFAGNAATAETNHRPILACDATVPPDVPLLNADPAATSLPSRVVLIGAGAPVKLEQFPPGIQFSASATDPEGSNLSTYWTLRRGSGSGGSTTAGSTVASGAAIPDESAFDVPALAGRYTVFLTVYDEVGLFDECRWVIDIVRNERPAVEVFSGRVHVEFGRLDEEREDAGLIPPAPAALRPGISAPLPVALPTGTTAIWDGLTLCPTAIAGPLAELASIEETVVAPAPVDVMLPPMGDDATDRWAFSGRTCVWAVVADSDLDPLAVEWEFPGPIFGSGTYYAATAIPAGFSADVPNGMPLGTFLRTGDQLAVYNEWVSFLYNSFGVIPAIVWEAWDDPCPGVEPENPCPTAISRGGVENLVATVTDSFVQPPIYDYTPVDVGPDAVEPDECGTVLFFSELRPNPPDPQPFQGVEVHARLSSLTQDCPVRFIVSGTDGYAVDTIIPTNKDGEATIFIPGAREGIVDTITAEVCRGPLSPLATPPPAAEQCTTLNGEPGWLLRIVVTYTF